MTKPSKKKISLELAQEQGWRVLEQDGTTVRVGKRFEPLSPLSWEDGGDLFERGMNAVEVFLECENGVIENTVLFGEFTPCSGRAIGGKAPAWIFPSMPLDRIKEDELPESVLAVIKDAVSSVYEPRESNPESNFIDQDRTNKITEIEYLNEDHVSFSMRNPVAGSRGIAFMSPEEANSHPLARALFQIEHIINVELRGRAIIVKKDPEGTWPPLLPLLAAPIRAISSLKP